GFGGWFAWMKIQEGADRVVRTNDLHQIGLAYHNFVDSERRAPENAADLEKSLRRLGADSKLIARLTDGSIVFLYGVRPLTIPDGKGGRPALPVTDTADAWGGEIIFDATQMDRTGTRPLILSTGPGNGKEIRNWD